MSGFESSCSASKSTNLDCGGKACQCHCPRFSKEVFQCSSLFSLQPSFAPLLLLGVGIEHALDVTLIRPRAVRIT
jgi:hypothetical protein